MTDDAIRLVLGAVDIIGSIVLLVCMQVITRDAGVSTPRQRWSQMRRVIYTLVSGSLFVAGIYRIEGGEHMVMFDAISHAVVVILGVLLFPVMRALNIISQDALKLRDGVMDHMFDFRRHHE